MNIISIMDELVQQKIIVESRISSMRTAVKQYSQMLGFDDGTKTTPQDYNLSLEEVRNLIEKKASRHLSPGTVRNLKNNISFLLRKARKNRLLPEPGEDLYDWNTKFTFENYADRARKEFSHTYLPCNLTDTKFEKELLDYADWSTKIINLERPASIKKRQVSMKGISNKLNRFARYIVVEKKISVADLSLKELIHLEHIQDYIVWWLKNNGDRVTVTLIHLLASLNVLAKDYYKEKEIGQKIKTIQKNLGMPVPVYDKSKRWLPLKEIERIGKSWHPQNAKRLSLLNRKGPSYKYKGKRKTNGKSYAYWVQKSLILRLLIRLPMRQRNFREMKLGKNLVKKDGFWTIIFKGDELKIARKNGKLNIVQHCFPMDLVTLLEEWLSEWRPRLNSNTELVFMDSKGRPFTSETFQKMVSLGTYKFTGISVTPHVIRDIWATEYIKETGDFIGAARRLGNNVKTVLKYYAHLLDEESDEKAANWIRKRLEESDLNEMENEEAANVRPTLRSKYESFIFD